MTEQADEVERRRKKPARMERLGYLACGVLLGAVATVALVEGFTWGIGELKLITAGQAQTSPEGKNQGQGFQPAKDEMAAQVATAEKESREHIDKELEHSKMLLDGLVAMVGVYTALLGLTALVTVKFSRDDAEKQMQLARDATAKDLERFQKGLEELTLSFPEFKQMGERMRSILHEIELLMPPRENWFQDRWFEDLESESHAQIQASELTVAAISIFALERAPRIKPSLESIYYEFALYYTGRSLSSDQQKGDFARALMYAKRVIDLSPSNSVGYRLQGAVYLERYRGLPAPTSAKETAEKDDLLKKAQVALDQALKEGTADSVDAAAYYDRALLAFNQKNVRDAIAVLERLLKQRDKVSGPDADKYLPDVYRNLACGFAMLADQAKQDKPEAQKQSDRAVGTIRVALEDFRAKTDLYRGLAKLIKVLEEELKPGGDLSKLDKWYVDQIREVLKDAQTP